MSARLACALAWRSGRIASEPLAGSCAPIELTITYRGTQLVGRVDQLHRGARSTVCLRADRSLVPLQQGTPRHPLLSRASEVVELLDVDERRLGTGPLEMGRDPGCGPAHAPRSRGRRAAEQPQRNFPVPCGNRDITAAVVSASIARVPGSASCRAGFCSKAAAPGCHASVEFRCGRAGDTAATRAAEFLSADRSIIGTWWRGPLVAVTSLRVAPPSQRVRYRSQR